jgi:6-phosphogluconolactonase (cycloisomerase 2 family)
MHRLARVAATAAAGLFAFTMVGLVPEIDQVSAQSAIVGQVYVNDNTARSNTIAGFDRHEDGTLSPIPDSPFKTGGAGTGAVLGSQGAIQITADGDFLIAVNAGSNDISVLSIADDGALTEVGMPVPSGGTTPLSLTVHNDLVYVANSGDGTMGANYSGFRLGDGGELTPIDGSTVAISATALPGQVLFDPTGTHLIGVQVGPDAGPSFLDSFVVGADGKLTAAPGSPYASQAIGPFGSVFSPTEPGKLFVSNAHAGPNMGSLSVYDVATDGSLNAVAGSPFPNLQAGSCWAEISPDGRYVFIVNTGVPSISRYEIGMDGFATLLGSTVFNNPTGLRPFDARISPDGKSLYVVDAGAAKISIFAVDGGNLTELSGSPINLPAGATPFGLVVS